jgi:hypothetical protein
MDDLVIEGFLLAKSDQAIEQIDESWRHEFELDWRDPAMREISERQWSRLRRRFAAIAKRPFYYNRSPGFDKRRPRTTANGNRIPK